MAEELDPVAKARAIAAKLGAQISSAAAPSPAPMASPFPRPAAVPDGAEGGSELGKRKNRWGEDGSSGAPGPDPAAAVAAAMAPIQTKKQKKLYMPEPTAEINYASVLIGPRGSSLHAMQDRTGAKVFIRGRGSQQDGPEADEPQHVIIEGNDAAVEAAEREVTAIFNDPVHAMQVKQQQLQMLSNPNGHPQHHQQQPDHNAMGYGAPPPAPTGEEVTINMSVSNALIGSIIGRGGENVQRMQRDFQINVQIGRVQDMIPGTMDRPVTLHGARASVEACKAYIEQILSEKERGGGAYVAPTAGGAPAPGASYGQPPMGGGYGGDGSGGHYGPPGGAPAYGAGGGDGPATVQLAVPNDKVGLVIGKGGGTIKGIQGRTGTNVQVPPQADADDPTRRTISITGSTREAADRAVAEIQNVLAVQVTPGQGLPPGQHPPGAKVVQMDIPDNRVGVVIGKGGATIKDLQNRTGARVQIPSQPTADTGFRTISISGVGDAPERARFEIQQLLENGPGGPGGGGAGGAYGAPPGYAYGGYGQPAPPPPQGMYGAPAPYYQPPYDPYGQPAPPMGYYGQQPGYPDPYAQQYYPPQQPMQPGYGAPPPGAGAAPDGQAAAPAPGQQQQQAAQPEQHQEQQQQQQQASAPAPAPAATTEASQYHQQFWEYAAYYGEKHAREAFSSWAPPPGTAPPPGITLPAPGQEHPPPAAS